jgi:hypothetical protein
MRRADSYTLNQLRNILSESISEFIERDIYLIDKGVSERSVANRLACYIQNRFDNLHVDAEYNRFARELSDEQMEVVKKRLSYKRTSDYRIEDHLVNPDIIIHLRGQQSENLLIIEIKRGRSKKDAIQKDYSKLEAFTLKGYESEPHYRFGLFIHFKDSFAQPELTWFQSGQKLEVEQSTN